MPPLLVRLNLPGFNSPQPFRLASAPPTLTGLACAVLEEIGGFSKEELDAIRSSRDAVPLTLLGELCAGQLVALDSDYQLGVFLSTAESPRGPATIEVRPSDGSSAAPCESTSPVNGGTNSSDCCSPGALTSPTRPVSSGDFSDAHSPSRLPVHTPHAGAYGAQPHQQLQATPQPTYHQQQQPPHQRPQPQQQSQLRQPQQYGIASPEPPRAQVSWNGQQSPDGSASAQLDGPAGGAASRGAYQPQARARTPELQRRAKVRVPSRGRAGGTPGGPRSHTGSYEDQSLSVLSQGSCGGDFGSASALASGDDAGCWPPLQPLQVDVSGIHHSSSSQAPVHIRLYQEKDDRRRRLEEARIKRLEQEEEDIRASAMRALGRAPSPAANGSGGAGNHSTRASSPGPPGAKRAPSPGSKGRPPSPTPSSGSARAPSPQRAGAASGATGAGSVGSWQGAAGAGAAVAAAAAGGGAVPSLPVAGSSGSRGRGVGGTSAGSAASTAGSGGGTAGPGVGSAGSLSRARTPPRTRPPVPERQTAPAASASGSCGGHTASAGRRGPSAGRAAADVAGGRRHGPHGGAERNAGGSGGGNGVAPAASASRGCSSPLLGADVSSVYASSMLSEPAHGLSNAPSVGTIESLDGTHSDEVQSLKQLVLNQQQRIEFLEQMHQQALKQLQKCQHELHTAQQQRFKDADKAVRMEQLIGEMQVQRFDGDMQMRLRWEDFLQRSRALLASE
eukprot:TRINITY_DN19009_c0_g1_i1.p1 TRINITY_DN19009_c0_g1~~TRINITY_DN19009_c0_g1_i1.p1  ORF type:complete len:731 (-),score=158.66 TRINITY_DN19009_c0_g1_i1:84-2276(-)